MKAELKKLDGLSRRLQIEVPSATVNAALERMYQQVQRKAKFKGFREGKAPMSMVKTEYKSRVELDVAEEIIREYYDKALTEHSLEPINFPAIEFDGFKENEPLKFAAVFEVRPEVSLKKYKGLEVEKEKLEIKEEVVDKILEDIRKAKATIAPVIELRAAQMGDVAIIDFDGRVDGKPLAGGSAQEHMLELGAKQFIDGFEEGVVGMQPGSKKTLTLKFPEDYQAKDIAGKDVEFDVTLKEIKKKVLPELDDEFAKSMGNHTTLEDLKNEIKKDVVAGEEKRVRDDLKTRILHALVSANPFEVPQSMVKEQKEIITEDVHNRMKQDGMTDAQFEEYKAKWDADFTKSAEFVIRSSMLVNTVAREENLAASDEDFSQRLESYAKQSGIEIEKIKAFYSKPDNRSRLKFQMTEEKVVELLIKEAKVKELAKDKLAPLK
ncbi:MAG: trigger factor [Oligoflexia bacterium]|nr:trigger factor [Oligoflexia bacterium]